MVPSIIDKAIHNDRLWRSRQALVGKPANQNSRRRSNLSIITTWTTKITRKPSFLSIYIMLYCGPVPRCMVWRLFSEGVLKCSTAALGCVINREFSITAEGGCATY